MFQYRLFPTITVPSAPSSVAATVIAPPSAFVLSAFWTSAVGEPSVDAK